MARFESIDDYINAMLDRVNGAKAQKAFLFSVQTTIGKMGVRIFETGLATNGGSIGRYQAGNKPLYITNFNSPRNGTLRGKGGKKKFKNGNTHRTTYYPNYKAFRMAMGREVNHVNLRLSGRLYRNFINSLVPSESGAKSVAIPSTVTPVKIDNMTYAIKLRDDNMNKALGAEKHFGKEIFQMTAREKIEFRKITKFEIIKAIGNA